MGEPVLVQLGQDELLKISLQFLTQGSGTRNPVREAEVLLGASEGSGATRLPSGLRRAPQFPRSQTTSSHDSVSLTRTRKVGGEHEPVSFRRRVFSRGRKLLCRVMCNAPSETVKSPWVGDPRLFLPEITVRVRGSC